MTDIRNYIQTHILEPLKAYPTVIQSTMLEIITDRLEQLYNYTWKFPNILSPNKNRLDILQTIANQFLFTIREEADLQEQIDILDHILYVYSRRGSIDTIENMWKYYGGDLPKDVRVIIPSYNLFRYSMSTLSGTHQFIKGKNLNDTSDRVDRTVNSPGVYEIRLVNNTYPIPDLREFMIKELVAAGNEIYFTNAVHLQVSNDTTRTNPYKYSISEDNLILLQLEALRNKQGIALSSYAHHALNFLSDSSAWSGGGTIYISRDIISEIMRPYPSYNYLLYENLGISIVPYTSMSEVRYNINTFRNILRIDNLIESFLYCTPTDPSIVLIKNSYNIEGNLITRTYPGYYVLGSTLLGEEVI